MSITFSCVIPCSAKDYESQNLKDLITSIKAQDFPQDQIEILVMGTEYGDSEQAKAAGIRQAKGDFCVMLCADNFILNKYLFRFVYDSALVNRLATGFYSKFYSYVKNDNSLNRYFSLIGNNDPIAFYLGKADRKPCYDVDWDEGFTYLSFRNGIKESFGDNGFFIRRSDLLIEEEGLNHYYPMDICVDMAKRGNNRWMRFNADFIWHRTSDNLFTFLRKRYRYARDLYCDRTDRRWKMFGGPEDYCRGVFFVASAITIIPCLFISIRGFLKVKDWAWFWHWPVCLGFLITYTLLAFRNFFRYGRLFQCAQASSSLRLTVPSV